MFKAPSHELGVCNGAMQELRRLDAVEKQCDQLQQAAQQALMWIATKPENRLISAGRMAGILVLSLEAERQATTEDSSAVHAEQQDEPVYQMQKADGSWVDQDKQVFDYNTRNGWPTRIVYTSPQPAQQAEPVAFCDLTQDGKSIAYFDGKPCIMTGKVGNDCHPHPLYTTPQTAQQPSHWISDTSVCGSPHTVSNEMYQRGRKAGAYEGYTRVFADPQPIIPFGYKLVPVEPTPEMLRAADEGDREYTLRNFGDIQTVLQGPEDHWCAMLAAAPEAPAQQPLTDEAVMDAFCKTPNIHQFVSAFKAGVRFAERAHGIK